MKIWNLEGEFEEFIEEVGKRREEKREEIRNQLNSIKKGVLEGGYGKIVELCKRFDGWKKDLPLMIDDEEIEASIKRTKKEDLRLIKEMIRRVSAYHRLQKRKGFIFKSEGLRVEDSFVPIERVLIYVPSGKAPYFSSLIMAAVPAKIAGVKEIIVTTPAREGRVHDLILATCKILGVKKVYRIGGAQAIYAFAYGISVPRVDFICGPGNAYVEEAKKDVFGVVGIDMPAGPTELFVLCTKETNPEWISWDLLSQAEHDESALIGLFAKERAFVEKVIENIERLLPICERKDTIEISLKRNGFFVFFSDVKRAIEVINILSPEHLEVISERSIKRSIFYPGIIYFGPYTSVALGDYYVGTNHILPTKGAGRFLGGLSVDSFLRRRVIVEARKTLYGRGAKRLAEMEGFFSHAKAIEVRGG